MIDEFGADVSRSSRPVLDNDRLSPFPREPVSDEPRDGIGRAAGSEGYNDFYRTIRIIFRPRRIGDERCQSKRERQRGHASAEKNQQLGVRAAHAMPPDVSAAL